MIFENFGLGLRILQHGIETEKLFLYESVQLNLINYITMWQLQFINYALVIN
jgi:hypothetical protein